MATPRHDGRPLAQTTPTIQDPREPAARRSPGLLQLLLQRAVAERREQDKEPKGRVRRAVVAKFAIAHRPASSEKAGRSPRPPLVEDLARFLVGLRIVTAALERREPAERGSGDVGTRRQHLERGDRGVAPNSALKRPGSPGSTGVALA